MLFRVDNRRKADMVYFFSTVLLLVTAGTEFSRSIAAICTADPVDVSVDTMCVQGVQYNLISIDGFDMPMNTSETAGFPSLPYSVHTFLLPEGSQIDSLVVVSETWDTLPGKYCLLPAQSGFFTDTVFVQTDFSVSGSTQHFPDWAVTVSRQGSAMGYSVASLSCSPLRYIPKDSTVLILTSATYDVRTVPAEYEQLTPERETAFGAAVRNSGVLSLVSNPSEISSYRKVYQTDYFGRTAALSITESPSSQGDGVDMVIVTGDGLARVFEEFADYRTCQGIITVVRTVQWIDQFYSGCDTQERIRNFIRDAYIKWGVQAVILGGDDGVVPVRESNGWNYMPGPFPTSLLPSDDYYADIDGNWSYDGTNWRPQSVNSFLDLCVGRWPCNTPEDVTTMFNKIKLYEQPDDFPDNFARKLLVIGSNNPAGTGAFDMDSLVSQLRDSHAVPEHLDPPATLYFPHSLPGGDLSRNTALVEFNLGYNLILHSDHSEIHKLATAGNGTLGQYMWDSDFSTMSNTNMPSILWTLGCDTGHFDGAYCYSEAGLLTSANSGLVASMSNSRGGMHAQKVTAYAFCDALYDTGWISDRTACLPPNWPLSYLGEAYRCSKNFTAMSFVYMNLLGSPLMYVWRDNPEQLRVSIPHFFLTEGVPEDIPVTVTDGTSPIEGATVCLWKKDEVFSVMVTDDHGRAVFSNVTVADGSGETDLVITAVKRRTSADPIETATADYIPGQITLNVLPATSPVISLGSFSVDPGGDGTANPGETVEIHLSALNSGGETAAGVEADMTLVSGGEYLESIVNSHSQFHNITPGNTGNSTNPLVIALKQDVPDYSTIQFNLSFTCNGRSGLITWDYPLFLTIYSESYALTVANPSADNSCGRTAEVNLKNLVLANCGPGEGKNLRITIDNLSPPSPFQASTLTLPEAPSNTAVEISGELNLVISPLSSSSAWLKPGFPGCSFDVTVESSGGSFVARNMDVTVISQLQNLNLQLPKELRVYETDQNSISIIWEHSGSVDADAFYAYCNDGVSNHRVYPLPVPVKQITIDGLTAGREYEVGITAIDRTGRESETAVLTTRTPCPVVDGWPLHLQGSPGGGPVVVDIDNDGNNEIVAAISSGIVYIIERDGTTEKLYLPAGYDFDRLLGCAVGDVDGDSNMEIVVTCQRNIEIPGQEQTTVVLFDRSREFWNSTEIASTAVNEEISSPNIAGTPVLFQADDGESLEIALRTRGNNGGTPHLYVWRYDRASHSWVDFNQSFPVKITGGYFSPPVAVDFDQDGYQELVLTVFGSSGVGTALLIADFISGGNVSVSRHNLPELDTSGELGRTFGTIAAAEQNGTFYISGAAKVDAMSGVVKKVYVYSLQSDPSVNVSLVWQTDWLTGVDSYGNMPGPSFGNIDSDPSLEVLYSLNGGLFNTEGIVTGWDLITGSVDFQSNTIPFNPIMGGGGASVKSQPVTGLSSLPGSGEHAIISCFSSLFCVHDPRTSTSMVSGFPSETREDAFAAPAVCDLDGNGAAEILFIDYSGYATLFDWQHGSYTPDGWHMYQDNPLRNGFYNTGNASDRLDIRVCGQPAVSTQSRCRNTGSTVVADIEVRNSGVLPEQMVSCVFSEPTALCTDAQNCSVREILNTVQPCLSGNHVEVAAFVNGISSGSTLLSLEDGTHTVEIALDVKIPENCTVSVVADPSNVFDESDETNNTARTEAVLLPETVPLMLIPTPARQLELTVQLPEPLSDGIEITVYALDGRVVVRKTTEALCEGTTNILLNSCGNRPLPSGVYTVRVEGTGFADASRKVIVLSR
jgi:hypothetical protein